MNIRKYLIALTVLMLALLPAACGAQEEPSGDLPELVIGSDDYRPYNYLDENGQAAGVDVALATEACRRMGYEPVFRQISWDEKDLLLESGQVDCLWGCFSMNGRENAYLWAGPYLYSDQLVAVRADSDIYTLADLADRRVAVQVSSKAESILSNPADARIPQLRALYCLVDMDQVATALRKYYVDACASHAEALAGALEKAGVSYRFLDEPLLHAQLGVDFAGWRHRPAGPAGPDAGGHGSRRHHGAHRCVLRVGRRHRIGEDDAVNNIKRTVSRLQWRVVPIIFAGILLFLLTLDLSGRNGLSRTQALTDNTLDTLRLQCISFHKLESADGTKSLFRLADSVQALSRHLELDPTLASNAYLEDFVDEIRLSGVALLNADLQLEASGYTRQYAGMSWLDGASSARLESLIDSAKIYTQRVEKDGVSYDVCAVARRDAPGVVIGFYQQPNGLLADTEVDMATLLTGLHLDRKGAYLITRDGAVLASSTAGIGDDSAVLDCLNRLECGGALQSFRCGGHLYYGARSACEDYGLYIYFPALSVFSSTLTAAAVFIALYGVFWVLLFGLKTRELSDSQRELRRSNSQLQKTVNMLHSLENIYFTIFYVDLELNRFDTVFLAPWLGGFLPEDFSYSKLKDRFTHLLVLEQYRDELDRQMSSAAIRETLRRDNLSDVRHSFYVDYQAYRGDAVNWCRVTVTAVDFDEEGAALHVLVVLQDINREKTKEAEYQAQIMEEAQSARLANMAKSEFLRRISHDIRTPVNGIQGYLAMAAQAPNDMELQTRCRQRAGTALNTLLDLVNNVLDMSKLESGQLQLEHKSFALADILDEVRVTNEPYAAEHGIAYTVECLWDTDNAPRLIGSPSHLRQILMNLVSNAIKYGRSGGCIRLTGRALPADGDSAVYQFTCADNGIGMSEEFQQHIFEPFMQESDDARTRYQGTGLGLSIVKRLVEAMGGQITFTSRKGVGTTFCVTLPFEIDRHYAPDPDEEETEGSSWLEGIHVLLAEDNELNMEIAEFLLLDRGASVTRAWNGKEALDAFANAPEGAFDVILMDIMMPVMNGLDTVRAIRALDRPDAAEIPIIAMSANAFSDDIQQSLDAGFNAHVAKPIDASLLAQTLRKFVPPPRVRKKKASVPHVQTP